MKNVLLMNKIAKVGTDVFDRSEYAVGDAVESPVAMMVRSASLHETEFGKELLAIARCGAGVNNIPVDRCAEQGIVVFNTPGANANGVKELAICALMLASRDIVGGVEWAKTLTQDVAKSVEKGKSAYGGCEIAGKTLGVIGLGAIGGLVANAAHHLGMEVLGCDPYITVNAAWSLSRSIEKAATYDEIYEKADYITLHVPATPTTKNMINRDTIAKMRDGVRIINLARADLVDAEALKEALASGKVAAYVTDFPTEATQGVKGIVSIPHLGACTEESEDNCAVMAAHELDDFLKTGNVKNSVNYPNVQLPVTPGTHRLCVMHKNIPNTLSYITSQVSASGINIENMANGSKGDYAYTIVETKEKVKDETVALIEKNENFIRVRNI
ncbi:MAG: 3-phosphoglycerate dehydrogenase [Clostridia bacterium]|nr:3-phosphoglycerate dehydrogenase [Clostridia bacterium]